MRILSFTSIRSEYDLLSPLYKLLNEDKNIDFNFPLEALKLLLGSNITVDKSKFEKPKIFLRYFDQVWDHND